MKLLCLVLLVGCVSSAVKAGNVAGGLQRAPRVSSRPTIRSDLARALDFGRGLGLKTRRAAAHLCSALPLRRRGSTTPRAAASSKKARAVTDGADAAVISALEARAWELLADDKSVWGSPVATSMGPGGHAVTVWKHWLPKQARGSASSVVKARGLVRATPEEVFHMVFDSGRTKEYNAYSVGRSDVAALGPLTKVVWNRTCPPGTTKHHDFCTLMHGWVNPKNGSALLLTRATSHPMAAPSGAYHRSEILLGANHMVAIGPRLTQLTTVRTTFGAAYLIHLLSHTQLHQLRRLLGPVSQVSHKHVSRHCNTSPPRNAHCAGDAHEDDGRPHVPRREVYGALCGGFR